ncbi:BrnT family toxin [Methylotuvimicrobium sp.]|uniref:BrnT family toxin n=1 Tax=Methylotuvimicrobium sp. TaxID=2822413 RepID=UPI003D6601A6
MNGSLRLHQAGESVVGRSCFDLAQHERPTTHANCSFQDNKNIAERGLSFERAVDFNSETAVIWIDDRKTYPEVRFSAFGLLTGRVHSLVFTETANGIRVISFRKANKRKVKRYEQASKS